MPDRPTMIQKIRWYYNQRDLLFNYVRKDLKERYVGSVFGFYWSVINPLILLGIYTFVFSVIFVSISSCERLPSFSRISSVLATLANPVLCRSCARRVTSRISFGSLSVLPRPSI